MQPDTRGVLYLCFSCGLMQESSGSHDDLHRSHNGAITMASIVKEVDLPVQTPINC